MPHECRITTSRITFLDGRRGGALDDRDLRTTFSMFSGMGLAIEAWKISKAVTVSFEGGRIEWVEASSYKKSNTKEYGEIATSYLLFGTMPLVVVLMGSQHPHPGRKTTTHVLGVLSRDDIVWSNPKFNVNDIRLMTQVDTDHTACVNYIMMSGIRTLRAFRRKASRSWMQSQVFGMMTDDPVPKGSNVELRRGLRLLDGRMLSHLLAREVRISRGDKRLLDGMNVALAGTHTIISINCMRSP